MKKPLPILRPNVNNLHAYEPADYPKPLDQEHCPICGWSHCKCEKRVHDKSEE